MKRTENCSIEYCHFQSNDLNYSYYFFEWKQNIYKVNIYAIIQSENKYSNNTQIDHEMK